MMLDGESDTASIAGGGSSDEPPAIPRRPRSTASA
jgi:hypothetical protein